MVTQFTIDGAPWTKFFLVGRGKRKFVRLIDRAVGSVKKK